MLETKSWADASKAPRSTDGRVPETEFLWHDTHNPPFDAAPLKSVRAGDPPTITPPPPRVTCRAVPVEASSCTLKSWVVPPTSLWT